MVGVSLQLFPVRFFDPNHVLSYFQSGGEQNDLFLILQNKIKIKYFNSYDGILFETTRSSLQKLFLFNYLYEIHSLAQLTRLFFRMFAMMSKPSPNR